MGVVVKTGQVSFRANSGEYIGLDGFVVGGMQPSVEVDATLTETGKAADAKAVGDKLTTFNNRISNYVTPQMFGAAGNGTDDDTNAFKDAIATGKAILIPDGTYLISDTLELNNSMIGLGLPKIITKTHIESLLYVYNKTQIDIENINFYETSCDNIIKLDWVRNSRFRNLRVANRSGSTLQSTNGVYLVKDCWANVFQNCTFYNLQNGIKADGDVNNLATTNFYGCYFGSNTNAIKAKSMSNCHFFGGWIEENENCFRIDVTNNMMLNSFTGVDFEINKIVIYADNVNSNSVLWNFSFSNCAFVCESTGDKINSIIFHDSSSKYLWINVNMDSCYTDSRFRNIAPGCLRTYLGLVGMNYRTASHGGSLFNTYAYIYPCYVNASGIDVNIKYDKVDVTNDGKTLTVNLPDYVFIHSITVNTQETVTVDAWAFSSSTTNLSKPTVTKNGNVNRCNIEGAVKRFIIKSDSDISDATISVNMADYSDFI